MHSRNIALIGFMGSGKSEVGKKIAQMLGMKFVDTDAIIEQRTKMSISEIFRTHGEAWFREIEKEVVKEVASKSGLVISTGGGVPTFEENMQALRSNGLLFYLRASPITLWRRIKDAQDRPLLDVSDRFSRMLELLERREMFYRRADFVIQTDELSVSEVASQIVAWADALPENARSVPVCLDGRTYHIIVGKALCEHMPNMLSAAKLKEPFVLLTDECVAQAQLHRPVSAFEAKGICLHAVLLPTGETTKSFEFAMHIYERLIEFGMTRDGTLIAFGGGVITDLGGFVAATYMRGISLVNAPTTLLGQVDAAVGGKVAVDHPKAKNLIGCFYQPKLVIADIETIRTLPERVYREGLAEVIKYGVIADANLFESIEQNTDAIMKRDLQVLCDIVVRCCEIKARIVERDEHERSGERSLLNYGHTFGHAIEAATGYSKLLHGEAVAIGMIAA
ncbi:MAG: 3-dehydroquinate synthase [Armatimonadetes bacterium]|nr:3-dehydroquinate synthase [Armatimonadota bacterium]